MTNEESRSLGRHGDLVMTIEERMEKARNMMNLEMEAMALEMPEVEGHPNRLEFHGVLTLVGSPSRRAPSGAKGHRVMLTRKATEAALPSLLGMALDYAPALDAHDARRKIGVITAAEIVPLKAEVAKSEVPQGLKPDSEKLHTARLKACPFKAAREVTNWQASAGKIAISGYLYAHDFSDVVAEIARGKWDAGDVIRNHGCDCRKSVVSDMDGHVVHVHGGGGAATREGGVSGDVDCGGVKGNW